MANTILKHPATRIILILAVIVVIVGFATDWTFGFKKKAKEGDDCTAKDNTKGKIDASGNCIAVEGGPGQPGGGQSANPQGGQGRYNMAGACGDKAGKSCGENCWYVNTPEGCECKCDKPSSSRMANASPVITPVIPVNNLRAGGNAGDDCSSVLGAPAGSCYKVYVNGELRCHCFNSRTNVDCTKVTCLPNGLTISGTSSPCCNPYLS